jgi:hypothetical protein
MPNTYESIATATANGSQSSITFSSIPATFTDVILVMRSATMNGLRIQVNSDTANNYSSTRLVGNGSAASSFRESNVNTLTQGYGFTAGVHIAQFMNYSNTTTNKTVITRANNASEATAVFVGLWRNTAAINSITVSNNTGNYANGDSFTIYGIKAA